MYTELPASPPASLIARHITITFTYNEAAIYLPHQMEKYLSILYEFLFASNYTTEPHSLVELTAIQPAAMDTIRYGDTTKPKGEFIINVSFYTFGLNSVFTRAKLFNLFL